MSESSDSGDPERDEGDAAAGGGDASPSAEMRAALAEVRREHRKAAFVYACVDAVCALLAVNLAAGVADLSALDAAVASATFESVGLPAPDVGTLASAVAGGVVFAAEFLVRTRRPAAERFEATNPEVREALRTARDAVAADRSNPMAKALYADVLDRLRATSSLGLLDATRLAFTAALALALSLATVQTAVVGVDLGPGLSETESATAGPADGVGDRRALSNQTDGLRDGDEVLGDPTNVSAGSRNLSAAVSASRGGEGQRDWDYGSDAGGGGADDDVDARRAGFASPDRVEDAALVQRYARELQRNATDG